MRAREMKIIRKILLYLILILFASLWIVPMYTLVTTAIRSRQDFFSGQSIFSMPEKIAWSNFVNALTKGRLLTYIKNDLIISGLKVPLGIFIEALAAFALTRLNIKHRTGWFVFFIIGMMLPMQTALVPINVVYSRLNLLNTYFGLFYVYVGFGVSFGILVLRGFFLSIPKEIDEAATIDGCNKWQLFWHIILPIAKPAVATLVIISQINSSNYGWYML